MHTVRRSVVAFLCLAGFLGAAGRAATPPSPAAAASNAVPGTMGEQVRVDRNGAFTFVVPIEVPLGIAGMQPKLALAYDSQQANGILGVGWSLSGLPTIERTKRIRAVDGVNGTIAYDADDRFSYEGQRLIVTDGLYGADGSVYRTEIESWNLVTSRGTAGAGPQYFTLRGRNGEAMQFGNTPDSRAVAAGRADVRSWYVNSVADANGNAMTVTYTADPMGTGTPDTRGYPLQIAYTTGGNGQQANRFVRFVYQARPDVERTFIGGSEVRSTVRLANVQTFVGQSIVSDYRITYEAGAATGRSRLTSITRHASDAPGAAALPPASFSYSEGGLAFSGKQPWLQGAFGRNQGWDGKTAPFTLADVNGDGFLDIVGFKDGVQVALGSATAFAAPTQWNGGFSSMQGWTAGQKRVLADINGDGLADVVGFGSTGVSVALSTGTSFTTSPATFPYFSTTQGWRPDSPVMLVDVNGDKMADIVGVQDGTVWVAIAQGDGTFAAPVAWLQGFGQPGSQYLSADLNGDGNADLITVGNDQAITVALSTGTAFSTGTWGAQGYRGLCGATPVDAKTPIMVADVNGDGLADVVASCDAVYVTLSNGAGFQPAEAWSRTFAGPGWSASNQVMMADLNGDGMADLVAVTGQGVVAAISDGSSFVDGRWNDASLPWGLDGNGSASVTTRLLADVNGDGLMDMIGIGDTNVYAGLSAGAAPDLMTGAQRSAGASYAVEYAPLSDGTTYRESVPRGLAQFQNYPPLVAGEAIPHYRSAAHLAGFYHVVKTLAVTDNPAVGITAFTYKHQMFYQDGLLDLGGRGWMGFATVTTDSKTDPTRSVDTYLQDFPFTGRLAGTTVYDTQQTPNCSGSPVPYSTKLTAFGKTQTAQGSSPAATPVLFVAKTAEQEQAYQGCGVAHAVGTLYAYDAYGNVALQTRQNLVDANGQPLDPAGSVHTLSQYRNDTAAWLLGKPLYRKVSSSSDASGISQFNPGTDLSLLSWTYDARGNVLTQGKWDDGNSLFLTTTYTYDAFGNRLTATAPSSSVTTDTYDPTYATYRLGRTVTTAPGRSLTWSYGYDPRFGKPSATTDPNGVTRITCFDGFGREAARQGPYPDARTSGSFDAGCSSPLATGPPAPPNLVTLRQVSYVWNDGLPGIQTSRLTSWPTGAGRQEHASTQYFDGLWRHSSVVAANPGEQPITRGQTAYGPRNRIDRVALPYYQGTPAAFVRNDRDVLGRAVSTSRPFGPAGQVTTTTTSTYAATASGHTVTVVSAAGASYAVTQVLTYGRYNNRAKLTGLSVLGGASYGYDLLGRPLLLQMPAGQDGTRGAFGYTYDSLGRTVTRTEPTRGRITDTYDASGNLSARQQATGGFTYGYDLIGRRTRVADSDGHVRLMTYDGAAAPFGLGRRASAQLVDEQGAVQSGYLYAYDAYGRRIGTTLDLPGVGTYRTATASDPMGRLVQTTNPDGSVVQLAYSGARLTNVGMPGGPGAGFSDFSAAGTARVVAYGNGVTARYVLNADESPGQLTITGPGAGAGGAALLARAFGWDEIGRLVSVSDAAASPPATMRQYSYSGLRLQSATDAGSGTTWTFGYDGAGNMVAYDGSSYAYAGTKAMSAAGGGAAFQATYDAMGTMQSLTPSGQPAWQFTTDMRGQLTAAKRSGDSAGSRYAYDAVGRRILAVAPDGTRTVYVSPGYMDVISNGASSPLRVLSASGAPFAQWGGLKTAPIAAYLHGDAQRSTILTTDASGAVASSFSYTPFGQPQTAAENGPRFLFTGKELDGYTGLYWMGSRAFHPAFGRFIKADDRPGGALRAQDALNDFAYVLNNPTSFLDPSGHSALAVASGACAVLSVGAATYAAQTGDQNWGVGSSVGGGACGVLSLIDAVRSYRQEVASDGPGQSPSPTANGSDSTANRTSNPANVDSTGQSNADAKPSTQGSSSSSSESSDDDGYFSADDTSASNEDGPALDQPVRPGSSNLISASDALQGQDVPQVQQAIKQTSTRALSSTSRVNGVSNGGQAAGDVSSGLDGTATGAEVDEVAASVTAAADATSESSGILGWLALILSFLW